MPPPSPMAEEQPAFSTPFSFTLNPSSSYPQPTRSGSGWSTRPSATGSPSAQPTTALPAGSSWTTSSAFFTSSSPYPSPASSPVSDVKSHGVERKSNSPQRRLDLQQLLAAAQQPPLPSPPATTRTLSASSPVSSSPPLPSVTQPPASAMSSVFSTSTAAFLQRHTPYPSPTASPATSPAPSPVTSSLTDTSGGVGRFSTPPRSMSSSIKKGLAASFATILSSPTQYNPGVQPASTGATTTAASAATHSASSSLSTGSISASMAACSLPAASPFVNFPVPLSAAFTTITSSSSTSTFSPSTSFAHPSYASTDDRSPTSHLSPLSSSSSTSSSSSYGSGSESTTPISARLHPLSRSTPSFSSPPAMGPSPLSSLLFAASELVTASSTDVNATCTAMLRLVLDHAQCDDAKVVTKAANGRWNIDVHVHAPHSSTAQTVMCTPPSTLDPHGLLYDSHSSVPDLPLSVLQLVSSTQSLLSLTSADVLSDPVMAADAFFSSRSLHHRPPLSLLCLPIVVCRRECGVLLLTWQRHVLAADCVSVPSVQLLMVQVCLLLERRREERRRVEWLMLEDECRERDEECKRVRRELHDTKAKLASIA